MKAQAAAFQEVEGGEGFEDGFAFGAVVAVMVEVVETDEHQGFGDFDARPEEEFVGFAEDGFVSLLPV